MAASTHDTISAIYSEWNAGNLDGVLEAFRALGPGGFTVEYIGSEPLEGVAAVKDMWDNYGGVCRTEIVHLIVNDNEAAAVIHNIIAADGSETTLPSIETYRIEGDRLYVRYYHDEPQSAGRDLVGVSTPCAAMHNARRGIATA